MVSSADVWMVSNKDSQVVPTHNTKACRGWEGPQLHSFLTSKLNEDERSVSHPSHFNLEKRAQYALNSRLGWYQSRFDISEKT